MLDDMSQCKIYNDRMWLDYLQNRLDPDEMERAQFHLHHCACCRGKVRQMRLLAYDMQELTLEPLLEVEKKQLKIGRPFRIVAVIALFVSVSIGSYYFMHPSFEESTIIITPPPEHDSQDSVKKATDSIPVADEKDTIFYEP